MDLLRSECQEATPGSNVTKATWRGSNLEIPKPFFLGEGFLWLVVSTPLKNMSQNGNLPQIGMNIKNI